MPIVSGLINYFKKLRGEKRCSTPNHPMGLGMRRLTGEPLEARCLLSTYFVDHTGADGHFSTIQAAIDHATDLDTIDIAAGTYNEHLTINNKSLDLEGNGAIGDGLTHGSLLPGDGGNVGISISGVGKTVTIAGLGISDWLQGIGVNAATVNLNNCVVTTSVSYGVQVNNAGKVYITGSDITHNGVAGVAAGDASTSGYAEISGSDLTGNTRGLLAFTAGTAKVSGSDLSGYASTGPTAHRAVINNNTLAVIDASGCYWGGAAGENDILGMTQGSVDFTPYLKQGLVAQPGTGFAGDRSELYVTAKGAQSGSTGRIQEGIVLIADGSLTGGNRRVDVLAGSYTEQVTITKSLELIGAGEGTTKILAPSLRTGTVTQGTVHDYIVAAYAPSLTIDVRIEGITIDANGQNKTPGTARIDGVFLRNVKDDGGTMAGLYASTIKGFTATEYESWGVVVYGDSALTLDDNAVSGFTRDGIDVFGDAGVGADPTVTISRNVVTGSAIGLNGIAIEDGAMATITGNTVTGMARSSPWAGGGILVWDSDNVIIGGSGTGESNTVSGNFYGIDIADSDYTTVSSNTLLNNISRAISLDNSDHNTVTANRITGPSGGTDDVGIGLANGSDANIIGGATDADGNIITLATAGTGNLYAIHVQGDVGPGSNTISHNTIQGAKRAVQIEGGNSGTTTISYNTIGSVTAPSFAGIAAAGGSLVITHNMMYDAPQPIWLYDADGPGPVLPPANVDISWNTIDGSDYTAINITAQLSGTTKTITHNTISGVSPLNYGDGIDIYNSVTWDVSGQNSGFVISYNEIYGGTQYFAAMWMDIADSTISHNYIHDNSEGIMLQDGTGNTIEENRIVNNGGASIGAVGGGIILYGTDRFNVLPGTVYGSKNNIIRRNIITGNDIGIHVTDLSDDNPITENVITGNDIGVQAKTFNPGRDPDDVIIFNNNISGNLLYGVNNLSATVVDASGNWWGDPTGPGGVYSGAGNGVSANVDFTPWLNSGEDRDSGTAGFQGDFSYLHVAAASPQAVSTGRIQEAIGLLENGALSGGARVVDVKAGTYIENVIIDKSLSLLGAKAGFDADTRFAAFTAGKADPAVESIITAPAVNIGNGGDLVDVLSSGVTVDGFVIDGNNPTLVPTGAIQINGVGPYVEAHNGIATVDASNNGQAVDNLIIRNNIVQNVAHEAIAVINPSDGSAVTSGAMIADNVLANFQRYGVQFAYNAYGTITGNTIAVPDTADDADYSPVGISVYDFTSNGLTAAAQTVHVTLNDVTVGKNAWAGIWANGIYPSTATLDISDNTVNGAADVADGVYTVFGVYLTSLSNGVDAVLSDNIIGSSGGPLAGGIVVWSAATTNPVSISGGSITNATVGIDLDNADVNFGGTTASTTLNVSDVAISGGTVGIHVGAVPSNTPGAPFYVYAGPNTVQGSVVLNLSGGSISGATTGIQVQGQSSGPYTASLNMLGSTTITGGAVGIDVDGANASATISDNHIYGNTTTGIRVRNGGTITSLADNDFNGPTNDEDNVIDLQLLSGAGTVTFGAGNKFGGKTYFIDNQDDQPINLTSYGVLNFEGYNPAVLADDFRIEDRMYHKVDNISSGLITWAANNVYVSAPGTGANDETIQGGINAADPDFIVNVEGGIYTGSVNVNKAVTLSPGDSPAKVTINGNLTMGASATLAMELDGATAGSGYDQLVVTGTVSLGGATLDASRSYDPELGTVFTIINGANPVSGIFHDLAGHDLVEGATVTVNQVPFIISYLGGIDHNDVTLTLAAPAEDWANDNWYEVSNVAGGHWGHLDYGDIVDNRLDHGGTATVTAVYGVDAFSTIGDAIGAVAGTGTVHVLAGTYPEQVTIQKSLNLVGEGRDVTTITAPADRTGYVDGFTNPYTWQSDYLLAAYGTSETICVSVSGLTFDANDQIHNYDRFTGVFFNNVSGVNAGLFDSAITGFSAADPSATGVRVLGDSLLTIDNNNVSYTIDGIAAYGDLVSATADPNVVISNNNIGLQSGVSVNETEQGIVVAFGATGTVSHNTIGAGYIGIFVSSSNNVIVNNGNDISGEVTGIMLFNASNTTVSGNTIADCSSNGVYLWNSAGNNILENDISGVSTGHGDGWGIALDGGSTGNNVLRNTVTDGDVGLWVGNGSDNATVANNFFTGNLIGVQADVYEGGAEPVGLTLHENDLSDNGTFISTNGAQIDASANWFGTGVNAAAAAAKISGVDYVDFTPMLESGDANSGAVGFQANYGSLTVHHLGAQTDPAGQRIQEAVNAVNTGGTVHVAAGIYVEQVEIDNNLTLQGAGMGTSGTVIQSPDTLSNSFTFVGWDGNDWTYTPVVWVHDANDVTIKNLTVDGNYKVQTGKLFSGIAYDNAGGTLDTVEIENIMAAAMDGGQHRALVAHVRDANVTLNVTDVNIHDFGKSGTYFTAINNTGGSLDVTMTGGYVTGAGATDILAQNGIQIEDGATGSFTGVTVSELGWIGNGWTATGIAAVYSGDVEIINNILIDTQSGIAVWGSSGAVISGNDIRANNLVGPTADSAIVLQEVDLGTISIGSGNKVNGTGHQWGLSILDATGTTSLDINDMAFSGFAAGSYYIYLDGTSTNVNATAATFEGSTGAVMEAADEGTGDFSDLYAVEDKILHAIDDASLGLVRVTSGYLYVTPNSYVSPDTHASVGRAAALASNNDVIRVQNSGSVNYYLETEQIVIDENNLSIIGESRTGVIVKSGFDTAAYHGGLSSADTSEAWWVVNAGSTLNISGMTLDGNGRLISSGMMVLGDAIIDDMTFEHIGYNPSVNYDGKAISARGDAYISVSNSYFEDIGRIGVFMKDAGVRGDISNNHFTGKGDAGDWLDYSIELGKGAQATITGNYITGNTGVAYDGSTSAGILVTTYYGLGTQATIIGNFIYGNTTGIAVGYDSSDTSLVTIKDNFFNGSGGNGVGIDVVGGKAMIQGNDLRYNNVGIQVEGGATVDAGGGHIAGLDSSTGDNILRGYTGDPTTGNYAIVDLNTKAGSQPNVMARNNYFGPYVDASIIENYIYDDDDDPALTNIDTGGAQEHHTAPVATVYVDDNWAYTPLGEDPDLTDGVPMFFGVNAFATIQDGINAVDDGGTVNVLAGTYVEDVVVSKSLSLLGAQASADARTRTSVDESIIRPSVSGASPYSGTHTTIITVLASNVTIEGFTIDGSNTALSGGVALTGTSTASHAMSGIGSFDSAALTGADVSVYSNVPTYAAISGLTIENNIIQNIAYEAIDIGWASNGAASGNNVISQNLIQNVGAWNDEGVGVRLYNNFYADVTANKILNTRMGVEAGNYYQVNSGSQGSIFDNEISVRRRGIFYNLFYADASAIPVTGNTITAVADDLGLGGSIWTGMYIITQQGTVTANFSGNDIDGSGSNYATKVGYIVTNTFATASVTISGGTVKNVTRGVWEDNVGPNGITEAEADMGLTISGVDISASQYGVYVHKDASNSYLVAANITGNTRITTGTGTGVYISGTGASANIHDNAGSIHGNAVGIDVVGGSATISGNHIYANTTAGIRLSGGATAAITGNNFEGDPNADNAVDVLLASDAGGITGAMTGNTFAGTTYYIDNLSSHAISALKTNGNTYRTSNALETSDFRIEDRMYHKVDDSSLGLITWVAGNVFVTDGGTDHSINRGITAASPGWTVNVEAGTYAENVVITKSLTLDGVAGHPADVVIDPASGVGVTVAANGVTLNDFTVTGATTGIANSVTLTGVTLNDLIVSSNTGNGISLSNAGTVVLTNVNSSHNTHDNLYVDGAASVTVTGGTYNSAGYDGIFVQRVSGAVQLTSVTANGNAHQNFTVGNFGTASSGAASVTVSGGSFSNAASSGIEIYEVSGAVGLSNVTATGNAGANLTLREAGSVSVSDSSFSNDGASASLGNMYIDYVTHAVNLTNVTADNSHGANGALRTGRLGSLTISNSSFSNSQTYGAFIWDVSGLVQLTDVTASGTTKRSGAWGQGVYLAGPIHGVTITRGTFSNNAADGIYVESSVSGTINVSGAHISDNATGIRLLGGTATISGTIFDPPSSANGTDLYVGSGTGPVTLGGNTFGGTTYFIDNKSPNPIDATGEIFPVGMSNFRIEDRMYHKVDNISSGLITWVANNVFVTNPLSTINFTDGDKFIQNGINAANPDFIVNVEGGIYTGSVNVNKAVTLSPGDSPAQVTINGNLTLSSSATVAYELDGTNPASNYDNFVVNGTVSLGSAVFTFDKPYGYSAGDTIDLINNDSTDFITGTFTYEGVPVVEGDYINIAGTAFRVSYHGGADSNDLVLTTVVAPDTVFVNDTWRIVYDQGTLGVLDNGDVVAYDPSYDPTDVGTKVFGVNAFANIQDGVDAVGVSTVCVLAGDYTEQVTIQKSLVLMGIDGRDNTRVHAPDAMHRVTAPGYTGTDTWNTDYILAAYDYTTGTIIDVNVSGFTFDANKQTEVSGADRFTGVYFRNVSGATAGLFHSAVGGFDTGDPSATGVRVLGNSSLTIEDNLVNYTINGIAAYGGLGVNPDPLVMIYDNSVDLQPGVLVNDTEQGIVVAFGAMGEVSNNTIGTGYIGIFVSSSDGVSVQDNIISDQTAGIQLYYANWNDVEHNQITGAYNGVEVDYSTHNTIAYNEVSDGTNNGIYLYGADGNTILDNEIHGIRAGGGGWGIALDATSTGNDVQYNIVTDSDVGLWVGNGSDAFVDDNAFTTNNYGIQVAGGSATISDNTIDGSDTGILVEGIGSSADIDNNTVSRAAFDQQVWGILIRDGATATVTRNTVGPFDGGIRVDNTSGVTVGGTDPDYANTVTGSIEGIWLYSANDCTVQNNIVNDSVQGGVQLDGTSTGNFILDNDISGSPDGILLWGVSGNTISGNIISDCVPNVYVSESNGIYLDASSGNFISGNIISGVRYGDHAGGWGIALDSPDGPSSNNTVTGNEISDSDVGIYVSGSTDTIGGTGNILTGNDIGLQIVGGSSVTVLDNSITGNTTGIEVDASTAMIQNNDLNGNAIGLLIQGGAIVDAGGRPLGSTGGNNFSGYTALATAHSGAIVDLNSDPVVGPHGWPSDAWALNNNFYSTAPSDIETVIYHDFDDSALGFVNYATLDNLDYYLSSDKIDEGQSTHLIGSFTNDPQVHTLNITWGDGSPLQTIQLDKGVFDFDVEHTYLDNPSGGATKFTITFTFTDSSGGSLSGGPTDVEVDNVTPTTPSLRLSATKINENQTTTLSGGFTDPGTLDTHTVSIDWGDGSDIQTVDLGAGVLSFSGIGHQYLDNLVGYPTGSYTISVTVTDKDGASSAPNTIGVEVDNVAPGMPSLNLSSAKIDEYGSTTLGGSFTDPGTLDTHSLSIDWGDGSGIQTVDLGAGVLSFSGIGHQYMDNPAGYPTGSYTINVTVTDKDGASSAANTIGVEVDNVAPTATFTNSGTITPITEGGSGTVSFSGQYDPSPVDTTTYGFHYAYDFNNDGDFTDAGDIGGVGSYASGVTDASYAIPSSYLVDGPSSFTVHGRIIDKDGGFKDYTTVVYVNNVAPTIALYGNPTVDEGTTYTLSLGAITDPGPDTVTNYLINWGDGTPLTPLTVAQVAALPSGPLGKEITHYYDDGPDAISQITVTLYDEDGTHINAGVLPLEVKNRDPYGNLTNGGNVNEGESGFVFWVGQGDPSAADAADLLYNYDFDNNGVYDVVDSPLYYAYVPGSYLMTPGAHTVKSQIKDKDGGYLERTTTFNVLPTTFHVVSFTANASGFDIQFNRAANLSVLNLYDGGDAAVDLPDVTVYAASAPTVPIKGSLVWNAATNTASWVKTGGVLAEGTYTVTLRSAADGWVDTATPAGNLLDGNYDLTPGDNYVKHFTVESSTARVLSIPDFARGATATNGQPVNVPADGTTGIPVHISNADGVYSVDFTVLYDPALLSITSATLASDMPSGWHVTYNLFAPGEFIVTVSGTTALSSGGRDLVYLTASVPAGATYGASEVIRLASALYPFNGLPSINGGLIAATADRAVHKAIYFGDADGDRTYTASDAGVISRAVALLDGLYSGFDKYDLTDPVIVADVSGNGVLDGLDASYVGQEALYLLTGNPSMNRSEIPDLPLGARPTFAGIDPTLAISSLISATPGSPVTVPVDVTDDLAGVYGFSFVVNYDTTKFTIDDSGMLMGDLLSAEHGWTMQVSVYGGKAAFGFYRDTPAPSGSGNVAKLNFSVGAAVDAGTSDMVLSGPSPQGDFTFTFVPGSVQIYSAVEGRKIFYNNSRFDRITDNDAIASNKSALLPGETATFANITSYSRGINGIMVDIKGLPTDTLHASDFEFKVGNGDGSWTILEDPSISIAVAKNAGVGGSDRITITWADNIIQNEWLQVTVKANANTGLAAADVFYFGNLVGESGNDATVDIQDEDATLSNRTGFTLAPVTNLYDYNRDGQVNATDALIARHNASAALVMMLSAPLAVSDTLEPVSLASVTATVAPTAASPIYETVDTTVAATAESPISATVESPISVTVTDPVAVTDVVQFAPASANAVVTSLAVTVSEPIVMTVDSPVSDSVTAAVEMPSVKSAIGDVGFVSTLDIGALGNLGIQPVVTSVSSHVEEIKWQSRQLRNNLLNKALFHDVVLGQASAMTDSESELNWSDENWVDDMTQTIINDRISRKTKPAKNAVDDFLAAYIL
jgi:parallel beta-helix repeat protein